MKDFDFNFYKGKKVLVTGHTGFKGAWLCRILLGLGAEVTGYALEPPTDPELFGLLDLEKNMNSVKGDIRDLSRLSGVLKETQPEIVLHLAAQPIVRESYANPVYTYETNVMGTVNILEAVRNAGSVASFLNVTTDKVYKNNGNGDTVRQMNWMVMIHIPTVNPVQSLLHTVTKKLSLKKRVLRYLLHVPEM